MIDALEVRVARGSEGWIAAQPRQAYQVLQRGLFLRTTPGGTFLLGVSFPTDCFERFLVPEHDATPRFWTNGLDGKAFVDEAFAVFSTQADAEAASRRWAWKGARVYGIEVDAVARAIWLDEVSSAGDPW